MASPADRADPSPLDTGFWYINLLQPAAVSCRKKNAFSNPHFGLIWISAVLCLPLLTVVLLAGSASRYNPSIIHR